MKVIFEKYLLTDSLDVGKWIKNKKMAKYYSRETAAAIVCVGKLLQGVELPKETPFYYAIGLMEYEDYGLKYIVEDSRDEDNHFSQSLFIEKGLIRVSPLNQFKVLKNMPLSFISIEYQFQGDNAVIYSSAAGLLTQALYAVCEGPIILGASKAYKNGTVEVGFSVITKAEIVGSRFLKDKGEAVEIFRTWAKQGVL